MTEDRITLTMSVVDVVMTLSEGNFGAISVIQRWLESEPDSGLIGLLQLDSKRLYGSRIWVLYKDVCSEDIERFKYHVCMELPNQETGELSITGPYASGVDDEEFWNKRQFGQPGSFWALVDPPTRRDYKYPIK